MIIDRKELVSTLTRARQVRPGKSSINILRCAVLDVDGAVAAVEATDMETYARLTLQPTESVSRIKGLVQIDQALDLLKALTCQRVWIEQVKDGRIIITDAAAVETAAVHAFPESDSPLEDFPHRGQEFKGDIEAAFSIAPSELVAAYQAVGQAVSRDESRPVLAALCCKVNGDITFAATNSYVLHVRGVDGDPLMDGTMLIPRKAIDLAVKHAKGGAKRVLFEQSQSKRIRIAFGDSGDEWIVRGTEGTFPNVDQLMPHPDRLTSGATFSREQGISAVKQVASFLEGKHHPLCVTLKEKHVTFQTQDGKGVVTLDADVQGDFREPIGVNHEFLLAALKSQAPVAAVTLRFEGALRPMLLLGETTSSPRILLMPIRLQAPVVVAKTDEPKRPTPPEAPAKPVAVATHRHVDAPAPRAKDKPESRFVVEVTKYAQIVGAIDRERATYAHAYAGWVREKRKTEPTVGKGKTQHPIEKRVAAAIRVQVVKRAREVGFDPARIAHL